MHRRHIIQKIALGESGLRVSPLAVGTGTQGWGQTSSQTRKGSRWLVDMLVEAYRRGINFWDLADQYGSHAHARKALEQLDRARIVINTKTTASDYKACCKDIDRFLRELKTDYFDSVLLHGKSASTWQTDCSGAMEALNEAKRAGKVRAVGLSCHSLEALEAAASQPWVDVLLARLNYSGTNMDAGPKKVLPILERAISNGKGVYAMKVLGCGVLASNPERAFRFVMDSGCAQAMTIGFLSQEEMRASIELYESIASRSPDPAR